MIGLTPQEAKSSSKNLASQDDFCNEGLIRGGNPSVRGLKCLTAGPVWSSEKPCGGAHPRKEGLGKPYGGPSAEKQVERFIQGTLLGPVHFPWGSGEVLSSQ